MVKKQMKKKKKRKEIVHEDLLKLIKLFGRIDSWTASAAVVLENHCWNPKKTEDSQDIPLKHEGFGSSNEIESERLAR